MLKEQLSNLYNKYYAENYEERFIHDEFYKETPKFEVEILKELLSKEDKWLDVGCGTGYFLSQFPEHYRGGLDFSKDMLTVAKKNNPNISFLKQGDFRNPHSEFADQWDVTSCMWGAYCYVESMTEFNQFIHNISSWTAPGGICFLPLIDFEDVLYWRGELQHYNPDIEIFGGPCYVNAVTWSYYDKKHDKMHENLISPHTEYIKKELLKQFEEVITVYYPPFPYPIPGQRKAFLAVNKKGGEISPQLRTNINEIIKWSNINKKNVISIKHNPQITENEKPTHPPKKLKGLKLIWHHTPEPIRKIGRKILGI